MNFDNYPKAPDAWRRMVIDWSVLMHMNWHKMRSPNFEARTGLEVVEFARNIVSHALYLVERIQPDELILAVDAPANWRAEVYARYYAHNVEFLQYRAKAGLWVVQFDRKTYLASYRPEMDKWEYKKLAKADVEASELADPTQWRRWSPCPVVPADPLPEEVAVGAPDEEEPVLWVGESPDWPALEHLVPKYKGNRATSKWDYETTRSEFKALGANLAFNVAGVLGGHAVRVALAEGDDVCAQFVTVSRPEDVVVLVTIDTDLHQLLVDRPDLRIFDPVKHRWVDKSPERAAFELVHKILKGDTADNICGVSLKGASSTLGEKGAEKLIEDNGGPYGIWTYLRGQVDEATGRKVREAHADQAPLDRNVELVALDSLPAEIEHAIRDALEATRASEPVAGFPLSEFGLTAADSMAIRAMARGDKEIDDGLREGDPVSHEGLGAKKVLTLGE